MGTVIDALINVGLGILMLLFASGKIRASKNPKANEVWRAKWGRVLKVAGIIVLAWGGLSILKQVL